MKVLHIINNLGSGGAEKLLVESLPLLNKINEINVDVLLLTDDKKIYNKELEKEGIKVETIDLNNIYNPLNIIKIKKYIEKNQYDIVHSHLFPSQYWVGIARKLLKAKNVKFITTEHSNNNRRRNKPYFRYLDKLIYSNYDYIICITDKVRMNLVKWIRPKEKDMKKFIVINNGVNINKYREAIPYSKSELNYNFGDNIKLICMVSRFSEAKDHPTLIKAMKCLPNNVHLLMIGEGPLKHMNQDLVEELGVNDRVHFLGFRHDVERLLKTSDIVVLSSHWEGLSLASIEGMASGKPFIASNVEGLNDIVKDAGLLFEEGNYIELANTIIKLLNDNNFYIEVSNKCFKRALSYDIELMLKETINLYSNLLLNKNE